MTRKAEIAIFGIIFLLGLFFRFFNITETPPGLYPDEAMNGGNALEALYAPPPAGGFKVFYPENNGREGLFINIQALSVKIFGEHPWSLRIVSSLMGTLTILGIYLLTRELFQLASPYLFRFALSPPLVALFTSFFLATSYWHINFSRIGFRAIMLPLVIAFGFYWLFKSLRTGSIPSLVLSGIVFGLGFYTYIAVRFVPFIGIAVLALAFWHWIRKRKTAMEHTPCVPCLSALLVLIMIVMGIPIGYYFLQHPADFTGRGGQVSVFSAEHPLAEFAKSTALSLGMFNVRGDCNPRHNFRCQPETSLLVGIFFLVGLFIGMRELLKKQYYESDLNGLMPFFFLLTAFFFMMLPATLTREGIPHALRSIGMIIPVMMYAGLGAAWLWQKSMAYIDENLRDPRNSDRYKQIRRIRSEAHILLISLALFIASGSFFTYFIAFAGSDDAYGGFSADISTIGEFLNQKPDDLKKYVIVNGGGDPVRGIPISSQPIMFLTHTFLPEDQNTRNLRYVLESDIALIPNEHPQLIVPVRETTEVMEKVHAKFPKARVRHANGITVIEN